MNPEKSPYDPPDSDLDSKPDYIIEIQAPVGRWIRFANYIVDYVCIIILVGLVYFAAAFLFGEEGIAIIDSIPDLVFGAVMMVIYYLPFEAVSNRTLGKLVTGTKVVNEDGTKPSFKQIFGRTLSRLIPFEPLSFFRSEGRGWHDTLPGVYVVKSR